MQRSGTAVKPQRSCICCKLCRDKGELIRFVLSPDGEVLPDLDSKLSGRGAYTCIKRDCLMQAVSKGQFKRAFKQNITVMQTEQMAAHVEKLLFDRMIGLIGLANKAGNVSGGGSMVIEALRARTKPGLILLASDISGPIGAKIQSIADANHVPILTAVSKNDFGSILGKAPRSAISIKAGGFVNNIIKNVLRYRNFLGEV